MRNTACAGGPLTPKALSNTLVLLLHTDRVRCQLRVAAQLTARTQHKKVPVAMCDSELCYSAVTELSADTFTGSMRVTVCGSGVTL